MELKALTIQKVNTTDIEKFHELRNNKALSPADYFSELIKMAVNPINNDSLQEKVNQLTKSLEDLQAVNISLLDDKQALEIEKANFELEKNKILAVTEELTAELNELKDEPPKTVEKTVPLKENEFICNPSDDALQIARKYRPFFKKEGLFDGNNEEYPTWLFNQAVPRFIKNRFE